MKCIRLVVVALTLSLSACGSEITGPGDPPPPTVPALDGFGGLGSGS